MVLSIILLVVFVYCIIVRLERWPLSAWPMYSANMKLSDCIIPRIQLRRKGETTFSWWVPVHYKDKLHLGGKLLAATAPILANRRGSGDDATRPFVRLERPQSEWAIGWRQAVQSLDALDRAATDPALLQAVTPLIEKWVLGEIERVHGTGARDSIAAVRIIVRTVQPDLSIIDRTLTELDAESGRAR